MIFLSVIVSLSLNKASFSQREINDSLKLLNKNIFDYVFNRIKMNIWLYKLSRKGFIQKPVSNSHQVYMFHEELAIYYKYQLIRLELTKQIILKILHDKVIRDFNDGNYLGAWLYQMDLYSIDKAIEHEEKLFYYALANGSYALMHKKFDELKDYNIHIENYMLVEQGLVFEKTGNIDSARTKLNNFLKTQREMDTQHLIRLDIIELNHSPSDLSTVTNITNTSKNLYNLLSAKFWNLHIQIHMGNFSVQTIESFFCLLDEVEKNRELLLKTRPYRIQNLVRKIYMDMYRVYYLDASHNMNIYRKICKHSTYDSIFKDHFEYLAHIHKTVHAQFIQYEVIYLRRFFIEKFETIKAEEIHENYNDDRRVEIEVLVDYAKSYYKLSKDEFEIFGDKTEKTVMLRLAELELFYKEPNFTHIEDDMIRYESFANSIQISEFSANANIFLAKFWILQYAHSRIDEQYFDDELANMLSEARKKLGIAKEIHLQNQNNYGEARVAFFEFLIKIIDHKSSYKDKDISILEGRLKHYKRESELIDILKCNNFKIALVIDIVKYYPIVWQ